MKFGLLLIDMLQRDGVMDGLGRKGERERERLEKETNGKVMALRENCQFGF